MPKAFSDEFRADVIAAARNRTGSIAEVAAQFRGLVLVCAAVAGR